MSTLREATKVAGKPGGMLACQRPVLPLSFSLLPGLWGKLGVVGMVGVGGGSSCFLWLSAFPLSCTVSLSHLALPHLSSSAVTRVLRAPLLPPPASGPQALLTEGNLQQAPGVP